MSDILIKNMEMPKSCLICVCDMPKGNCDLWRNQTPEEHRRERHPDCPLIEVPPHGRLIDADAFIAEQRHLYCENCARRKGMKNGKMKFVYDIGDAPCRACGYGDVLDDIDDAPTIIPVDKEDADDV